MGKKRAAAYTEEFRREAVRRSGQDGTWLRQCSDGIVF